MHHLLEIVIEAFVFIIFAIPGAFFRWIFTGRKRTYKEVLLDDNDIDGAIGMIVTGIVVAIVIYYCR